MILRIVVTDRAAPRICPYCHDGVDTPGLALAHCGACGTAYHEECAKIHGHCALLGCEGRFGATPRIAAGERLALVVRGLGREPGAEQVAAVERILGLGRYEAAYRLRSGLPLVLGYFDRAVVEAHAAALARAGLAPFAVEPAVLAAGRFLEVRSIEREGQRLLVRTTDAAHRSSGEVTRVLDLDAPRVVVRGNFQVTDERIVHEAADRNNRFKERHETVTTLVPFAHVYVPGDPVPLAFSYDALHNYTFLGDKKSPGGKENFRTLAGILCSGSRTIVDATLEAAGPRGSGERARIEAASRLLFHALGDVGRPADERAALEAKAGESKAPDGELARGDTVAIVGLGRVGERIGRLLRGRGVRVLGTKRSPRESSSEAADRIVPVDLALKPEAVRPLLEGARSLVYAVAPGHERESYELVYGSGLRSVLEAARDAAVPRIVVLGSTGVYGEDEGRAVSEETPPEPREPNGRTLLHAERAVRDAGGLVLRLAGLYARGRGPQTALERAPRSNAGRPRLGAPAEKVLNLLHEADAALAAVIALDLWAEASRPVATTGVEALAVLNVSDGVPIERGRFYAAVARASRLLEPTFDLPQERGKGFGLGRRIDVSRLFRLAIGRGFPNFPGIEFAIDRGELP